ncbi:MAG: flippase-like domain-containing protein [Prevotella sp.]|nr:flippase-like domain-containing protein [Prevotella sp.]
MKKWKWTKQRVTNLFFIIGVVTVVVMFFTFDMSFADLWHRICDAGYWLIPILGLWIIIYAMNAVSWGMITNNVKQKHHRIGMWRTYKLTISGYALNYTTPVAGLGGEPYRIMELSKDIGNQRATSSVILYVMTHILAHFIFWLVGIAIFVVMALTGRAECTLGIAIITVITTTIIGFGIYAASLGYRHGLVFKAVKFMGRIPGLGQIAIRTLRRHGHTFMNIDEQIRMLNQQDKKTFYGSLTVEFLSRMVQSLEIFFMLQLAGAGAPNLGLLYLQSVVILTVTTIMSNLLGFLPMQLGGQEGGIAVGLALLGIVSGEAILCIGVICRVREIFWIIVGLILMKINQTVKMKTAVIMAAGMGTRFGDRTMEMPKGFIPFNGVPMVERSIRTLILCGIRHIIIGTGYHKEYYEELAKKYKPFIECVFSPRYAETHSMYTLWNCRQAIGDDDFVLLESNLVYEKSAIESLKTCPFDSAMLITPETKFQDQYYVLKNDRNELVNCSTDPEAIEPSGELVGIHKVSNHFYKILCSEYEKIVDEKPKLGYESMLLDVSQRVTPMHVMKIDNLLWYRINNSDDLKYAEEHVLI